MHPSQIGPYRIERKIGAGGMGTVYHGRHAETGQEAAVKVLPASLAREEGFVARFAREIDAMKKLTNAHVVRLYESGVDQETYYYAMEYIDGETLTQRLRRDRRIGWKEVIHLAVQICTALKAAHDAGIIHRDLKPSNLLITPDGTVKLTDFGVAQVFAGGKLTITGGIIGTAEYMSPEQAQGRRATKKSDLYSLGAVMYVMLTGRPPFSGKTTIEVIQKHKYGQFDRPGLIVPEIPHWLEEIVCQLLEKDPDKRFADAYVLSRRLQEVLRKVELSTRDATLAADDAYDGSASTASLGGKGEAGAGTLMRDLVRAEIEHAQQRSPLGNLLNSTWMLVALLVLLIVGGIFWFQGGNLGPQEQFDAGVALMQQPEGEPWLEARDEYFLPLLDSDPRRWQARVEPYLRQIEVYELKSDFAGRRLRRREPKSEAERFLQLARHYRDAGDTARAEQVLAALGSLLSGDPEYEPLYQLTQELLAEIRSEQAENSERYSLLQSSLARADQLASEGRREEARSIWAGVIELYDSDPGAQAEVGRARDLLSQEK